MYVKNSDNTGEGIRVVGPKYHFIINKSIVDSKMEIIYNMIAFVSCKYLK